MFLLITSWWMGCEDEWIVLSALGKSGMLVGTTRSLLSSERALKPDDGDRTTAKSLSHETFLYHSHIYFCFLPPFSDDRENWIILVEFWLGILNCLDPPELPKGFAPCLQSLKMFLSFLFCCSWPSALLNLGLEMVSFCAAQWLTLMWSLWMLLWCWVMLCI